MNKKQVDGKVLLTPQELGERWGVSVGTLSNWRCQSDGPKYLKIKGKVLYSLDDIQDFEDLNLEETVLTALVGDTHELFQ